MVVVWGLDDAIAGDPNPRVDGTHDLALVSFERPILNLFSAFPFPRFGLASKEGSFTKQGQIVLPPPMCRPVASIRRPNESPLLGLIFSPSSLSWPRPYVTNDARDSRAAGGAAHGAGTGHSLHHSLSRPNLSHSPKSPSQV